MCGIKIELYCTDGTLLDMAITPRLYAYPHPRSVGPASGVGSGRRRRPVQDDAMVQLAKRPRATSFIGEIDRSGGLPESSRSIRET